MPLAMSRKPAKVRLQKTLKEALRRCVYRRWEAEVKGKSLITKTTDLERMYRGNTPYPIGKPRLNQRVYPNGRRAQQALRAQTQRRSALGYRVL